MNRELLEQINRWFDDHRTQMLEDLKRIVRIPSVSVPWREDMELSREEYGPFGPANKRVLEEMLLIGKEHGFDVTNYEDYVGRISNSENPDMSNTIGFWNHLDVVPVGNDWSHDPFDPIEKEGFLIARGAQDNKGPAVGMLYLMQCIRELGIPMRHSLCLFAGTDEERGMEDLEYYTAHYKTPGLSMIADSGFPVCYGEKGIIEGKLIAQTPWSDDVISVFGGHASNMIPDRACAVLKASDSCYEQICSSCAKEIEEKKICVEQEDGTVKVTAFGTSRHSAFPEGSVNAFYILASAMKKLSMITEQDRKLFAFLEETSCGCYGQEEGIAFEDEVSGRTTCTATVLTAKERKLCLNLNIRYSITADSDAILSGLETYAKNHQAVWQLERDSKPGYFPKEHPAVDFLTGLYNEWQGLQTKAFVMGGGTYARKLPNAFAYGIGGMPETQDDRQRKEAVFAPGKGGAHEPDEGLNLRMFFDAIAFYTLAVIELDKVV